jgi:Acyl-CoA dehydrogenase, middle domain/Acyl-CoA dehydrogenase, N-terminal domain
MMPTTPFEPSELPPEVETLRHEVRAFLADTLADYAPSRLAKSWAEGDADFTRKVAAQGWIGMTWPKKYGGRKRSFLERYVVLEEMLAAGAPVCLHWIADRQSGPLIMKFGAEDMRQEILPKIVKGEAFFCIGMSEPDSGSDLAGVRTKAEKVDGGWRVNGAKVWTSGAHKCHYMIGLFRTDPKAEKHDGLSQFLVDLKTPGITIRPIHNLTGEHDFNQVYFDDVFLPDDRIIGEPGDGWKQVLAELAFERAGPERYMSNFPMIVQMIDACGPVPSERSAVDIGRMVAQIATMREMSVSVAGMQNAGMDPALQGTMVKEVGVTFEQSIPGIAHDMLGREPLLGGDELARSLAYVTQASVSFSLRGGTREVVRGIIARGLGLR